MFTGKWKGSAQIFITEAHSKQNTEDFNSHRTKKVTPAPTHWGYQCGLFSLYGQAFQSKQCKLAKSKTKETKALLLA